MTSSQTKIDGYELKDRWIGRQTDKGLDILTDGWIDKKDGSRDSKTDRWRDCRQMDGITKMDGETERQMERETDKWKDRRTDGRCKRQMDGLRQKGSQCFSAQGVFTSFILFFLSVIIGRLI